MSSRLAYYLALFGLCAAAVPDASHPKAADTGGKEAGDGKKKKTFGIPQAMNNPFKSILFLCAILLASLPAFGGVDDFKDFQSFKDLKAEDFPKLLDFLKQNGKFKDEKFNGDISFNNYLYWLGLCNLNDKDFRRAYISFLYGASFACTIKSDKMAHCKLAAANALLLLRPSATNR